MNLTPQEKAQLAKLLAEQERRRAENKLAFYKPYKYQSKFHNAGANYSHRLLMAANRIGKSFCGAMEVAIHATGRYPKWWKGLRFDTPVTIICGGQTTERTRDICQKELMGDPTDPAKQGHGAIPKECIVDTVRRAGIPNALSAVLVKHVSGANSKIVFNSYESGKKAWMGDNAHFVWLDEEPPEEIYTQALRAIVDLQGKLMMTFTPENGITNIVQQFTNDLKEHQYLQNATWDDAPHITEKVKQEMLAALPPHERDMRMKGIPMVGSGLVYPVPEDDIICDPFEIPEHWRRISGIDFGFDHATAWANVAYNPESDVVYVTEAVKIHRTTISEIASVLKKKKADTIPVAWPHDGLKHDSNTGRTIRDLYEAEGLKMLPEKFTNPPSPGMPEGSGGIGIEAGVAHILDRMCTGRFKVFKTEQEWFQEFRMYHRKNGKIVDRNDDLMAATRYAVMSLRFAITIGKTYDVYLPKETDFADSLVVY
ncbi:MAG: hypothetical protein D6816_02025 [Bacteroidetes bacterium]|nr:MAG: hypothetical protein D6816_02025 [Bacteroidota bacterium]